MKRSYVIGSILLFLLFLSNLGWFLLYKREQTKLKNMVVPSFMNDYYTKQLILTNYAKSVEEKEELGYGERGLFDVPLVTQNPDYPNGCEAASAVMLLNYYGVDISLKTFIDDYLPQKAIYEENGLRYGPDPSLYYAGDPASSNRGWGCFNTVIEEAISNILKDYHIEDKEVVLQMKKVSLYELKKDRPMIIWTTIDYDVANYVYTWVDEESMNLSYTYPRNSHVVVITGYDDDYYYINDPLKTEKNIKVEKGVLEKSFDSLGRQSIYIE